MVHRKNFLTVKFRILFFVWGGWTRATIMPYRMRAPAQLPVVKWILLSLFFRFVALSFSLWFLDVVFPHRRRWRNCGIECDAFTASIYRSILIYTCSRIRYMAHRYNCTNENCSGFEYYFFLISIFNLSPKRDYDDDESKSMEKIMIHNDDHCKWSAAFTDFDWPSNLSIKNVNENQSFMFTMKCLDPSPRRLVCIIISNNEMHHLTKIQNLLVFVTIGMPKIKMRREREKRQMCDNLAMAHTKRWT